MTALVQKGILVDQHDSNGLTTYAFSGDRRIKEYIDELAKLDWSEAINLRKQLKEETVSLPQESMNWVLCNHLRK